MAQEFRNQFADQLNRMLAGQAAEAMGRQPTPVPQFGMSDILLSMAPVASQALGQYQNKYGLEQMGIDPQVAEGLSMIPEDQQKIMLQNYAQSPLKQQEMALKYAGQQSKEADRMWQFNKERLNEYTTMQKGSREALNTLSQMEELNETKGELDSPLKAGFVKFLGNLPMGIDVDATAFLSPGSQEFGKLETEFLRGMKSIFGPRITQAEMKQFMRGIPNLLQSTEGRRRVIKNLKNYYQGQKVYNEVASEIIAANGGVPPYDLGKQVEDRVGKQLDQLAKRFDIPKQESREVSREEAAKLTGMPLDVLRGRKAGEAIINDETGETLILR